MPVCQWIERMNHLDPDAGGAWLDGDALPATLAPLLRLVGHDAVPVILDATRAFEAWAGERRDHGEEPPRAVGSHATRLRGVEAHRYTSSYTLWMVQRPLDAYRALAADGRAVIDRALAGTGCEALLAHAPRHRLGKRRFRLVFEPAT
jgi:hypothetical protein